LAVEPAVPDEVQERCPAEVLIDVVVSGPDSLPGRAVLPQFLETC
jgi:hypothetical protein